MHGQKNIKLAKFNNNINLARKLFPGKHFRFIGLYRLRN